MATQQSDNYGKIKSKLLKPALTSHYKVYIPLPENKGFLLTRSGNPNESELTELIQLSCIEASLPGSSLATIDIDNDYHGISEKHAYRRIYDDRIDFTFLVDGTNYTIIKFFESWIAYAINEQYGIEYGDSKISFDSPNYTYRVNYPKSYYSQKMTITKFERDEKNILEYIFINCFPISINSMPVSYEQPNLLKCTVSFFYSRYRVSSVTNENTDEKTTSTTSSDPSAPVKPSQSSPSSATEESINRQYSGQPGANFDTSNIERNFGRIQL